MISNKFGLNLETVFSYTTCLASKIGGYTEPATLVTKIFLNLCSNLLHACDAKIVLIFGHLAACLRQIVFHFLLSPRSQQKQGKCNHCNVCREIG